ncbi:MAG: redox-sensing transcriptional repressor Rex [Planctomycetota bacterium]
MNKTENIPSATVRRLSLYLRQLEIFQASGRLTVSSKQLGETLQLSDAQVRRDLAYFGQFGQPGVGYRAQELIQRLRRILGTDKSSKIIVVGAGNLGRALIAFRGLNKHGFEVMAAFDTDGEKIGQRVPTNEGIVIQPISEMAEVVRVGAVRLGILAVPASSAQIAATDMVKAGIRGILNFAPVTLQVDPSVAVSSVDIGVHLEQLSFLLSAVVQQT